MTKHTEILKEDEVLGMRTILTPEKVSFICLACNNHNRLVEAIKKFMEATDKANAVKFSTRMGMAYCGFRNLLSELDKDGEK